MCVDKVDRAGTSGGNYSEIIALREQGIEGAKRVRPRIVAARDVRFGAESGLERYDFEFPPFN